MPASAPGKQQRRHPLGIVPLAMQGQHLSALVPSHGNACRHGRIIASTGVGPNGDRGKGPPPVDPLAGPPRPVVAIVRVLLKAIEHGVPRGTVSRRMRQAVNLVSS